MQGGQAFPEDGLGIETIGKSSRRWTAAPGRLRGAFNTPVKIRQGTGMTRVVRRRKGESQEEESEGDE